MDWFNLILIPLLRSVALIIVLLTGFAYLTWYERKLLARFQVRYGPNRAGPKGLLQPIADAVKAIFKEEIIPDHVDKPIYLLGPAAGADSGAGHLGRDSGGQGRAGHGRRQHRLPLDSGHCRCGELRR